MGNELVAYSSGDLVTEMEYAKAVSVAGMLPQAYRGKPADIMLAVGLGRSMGLSPAESLYRIAVIAGKPTASAELIAANVRKAGHRLRVSGDDTSATCTIIRADDPDFEFTVTRDLEWAARMGLARNDNYSKQAGTMLQWRAITACARLACPEALYGVAYSPDEMGDMPAAPATVTVTQEPPGDRLAALTAEPKDQPPPPIEVPRDPIIEGETVETPMLDTRGPLARAMFAAFRDAGLDDKADRLLYISDLLGRKVTTSSEMTDGEAIRVLDALRLDTPEVR